MIKYIKQFYDLIKKNFRKKELQTNSVVNENCEPLNSTIAYTFLCTLNHINIVEDLGEGVIINPHDKNKDFPIIKITNNAIYVDKYKNSNFKQLIGLIEYHDLFDSGKIVVYNEGKFEYATVSSSIEYLNLHLFLLKMFFLCLWIEKDNSIDFEIGFLCFEPTSGDFRTSSNFISGSNFNNNGKKEQISFTKRDLEKAADLLNKAIIIQKEKSAVANEKKYSRGSVAMHFIQFARNNSDLGLKMLGYCSCLETLFSTDNDEITHKLSERIARFIGQTKDERIDIYQNVKKAYAMRSKVVHGGHFDNKQIEELKILLQKIDDICRKVTKYCLDTDNKDNIFEKNDAELNKYFVDLIMK